MLGVSVFKSSRRGQITLFVIIALVVMIAVGLFLFLSSNDSALDSQIDEITQTYELNSVESLIDSCLEDTIYATQNTILYRNFYYDSQLSVDYLPYFYFAGVSLMPEKSDIEKMYADEVREDVIDCLDNFTSVRQYLNGELILEENYLDLSANMAEDKLTLMANINGGIQVGETLQTIQSVSTSVPSKVGTFYQGIMLMLYPPIQPDQPFYEPAQEYLEIKGISFYGRSSGAGIEMYFLLEEDELPEKQISRLSIAFRF